MANIDFPSSPINGQIYTTTKGTWIYRSAKNYWENISAVQPGTSTLTVDLGSGVYTDALRIKSGTEAAGNPFLYAKKESATAFTLGGYNGSTLEGALTLSFPSGVTMTGPTRGPDGSASSPTFGFSGTTGLGMYRANAVTNILCFATNSVERMRINGSGQIGIGANTSSALVYINGQLETSSQVWGTTSDSNTAPSFSWSGDTNTGILHPATSVIGFTNNGAETVRIAANGNVGIATTAPTNKLSVNGTIDVANQILGAISDSNTAPSFSWSGDTNTGMLHAATGIIAFSTAGVERVRISSSVFTYTNPTSGAGAVATEQTVRLTANGTAFGPAIGDFFGATTSISLEASSVYEIIIYAAFTKTTAGTATWTLTASSAPTRMIGTYLGSPITGIAAGAPIQGFAGAQAATTAAFAATGSLSTGVNHAYQFMVQVHTNLACNFRLQLTQGAGTATPLAGSYYTVKKISSTTGTFVA